MAAQVRRVALSCPLNHMHMYAPAVGHNKFCSFLYNKTLIDPVCLVKMAGYWVLMDLNYFLVYMYKPAIFSWQNKLGQLATFIRNKGTYKIVPMVLRAVIKGHSK